MGKVLDSNWNKVDTTSDDYNVTDDDIRFVRAASHMDVINGIIDEHLQEMYSTINSKLIIGINKFFKEDAERIISFINSPPKIVDDIRPKPLIDIIVSKKNSNFISNDNLNKVKMMVYEILMDKDIVTEFHNTTSIVESLVDNADDIDKYGILIRIVNMIMDILYINQYKYINCIFSGMDIPKLQEIYNL